MGEAGRKLTIRMPDGDRLAGAEVALVHIEAGGRIPAGAPVVTLRRHRREHVVRAPRPGRIVPLVVPGDRVRAGDPLCVLEPDEAARPQKEGDDMAPVAGERRGVLGRVLSASLGPISAIALYVAACLALLPVPGAVGDASSLGGRALLLFAVALAGILVFRLFAPPFPGALRTLVRLLAIALVGIASAAVLHGPAGADEESVARCTAPPTLR